jgi:hypothetical protein
VSVAPPCCETASTTFDASGDAIVTIHGNNGAVNVTYTGPVGRVAVTSGGTLLAGGTTAYTNKTADPEVVEFYAGPQPLPSPSAIPTTSLVRCVNVFVSNPMCKPLPSSPAIAANSAAWAALLFQAGHDGFSGISAGTSEESEPLTYLGLTDPFVTLTLACTKETYSPGTCATHGLPDGSAQQIPLDIFVSQGSDHHAAVDDVSLGGERDYWLAPYPVAPLPTLWAVGGAGFCSWSSDGTNCSGSTATNIATSLGGISQADLTAAEASPNGSLPYAISVSALCADPSFVYPASSSDGSNTNTSTACVGATGSGQRPPEGTRGFLALTDAAINATTNAPYVKAILRTMDAQHMGFTITDTDWPGSQGLNPAYRHDSFAPQAAEIGITSPNFTLPITTNGFDLATVVRFCSNGSC